MKTLILTALISVLAFSAGTADVPRVLNHQGMLTDATGAPLNGEIFMIFQLYESAEGGTSIWSEAQRVDVIAGVFNVYLGEVADLDDSLFMGQDIWLGVTVESDTEMTPRLRIGSVIYAFTADNDGSSGSTWYEDSDNDGYGNPAVSVVSFTQPAGYVANGADCDDGADYIHPGAEEFCDGLDYDCDGSDADGLIGPPCPMQVGVCAGATQRCGGVLGWLPCGAADYGPYFEPVEISCDGLDNNCNGAVDEYVNCEDGNVCTIDICNGLMGCTHTPTGAGSPCDDGNPCTVNDICDGSGNCIGTAIICDDGNPCTDDYCDPLVGCVYAPSGAGYACDDGSACTVDDMCDGTGTCIGTLVDCNDGIACTMDYCDGDVGCINELMPGLCLINGICYSDGERDPGNECRECQSAINAYGWTNSANGTSCQGGTCQSGTCVPD